MRGVGDSKPGRLGTLFCLLLWVLAGAAAKGEDSPLFPPGAFDDPAPASQPDTADVPATQPSATERVAPWFLTLPASLERYQHIQAGRPEAVADLPRLRQASFVMLERDELGLLAALAELKAGRTAAARRELVGLTRAASPKVASAARRYELVLTSHPTGKVTGASLADYGVFQAACRKLADRRATEGDALLKESASARPKTVDEWQAAWSKLGDARSAYASAGQLDESVPGGRTERVKVAERELAEAGVRLFVADSETSKAKLIEDLGALHQGGTGRWGPPLVLKRINDQIDALAETKKRALGLVEILAVSARPPAGGSSAKPDQSDGVKRPSQTVRPPVANRSAVKQLDLAALRQQANEMDCLRFPGTADGERQFKALSQFFKEVKASPPAKGKESPYRLLRLEKILR